MRISSSQIPIAFSLAEMNAWHFLRREALRNLSYTAQMPFMSGRANNEQNDQDVEMDDSQPKIESEEHMKSES